MKVSKYGPEITPYLDTFHALRIFGEIYDGLSKMGLFTKIVSNQLRAGKILTAFLDRAFCHTNN